MHTILVGVLAC